MSGSEEDFCTKMKKATRKIHAKSDALVNAKLAFGMSDDNVWADGLLVFYEVFKYLEGAMLRLNNTPIGQIQINALKRTDAFEKDLKYYLGEGWEKNYSPRKEVTKYLERLKEIEETEPVLIIAYIYHLYMGLLSGGIILRKKRELLGKIKSLKPTLDTGGNNLTDFGENNIYKLKSDLRQSINSLAELLHEDTRNKIIEESITVYVLNNVIIRSVRGADRIVLKKLLFVIAAVITVIAIASTFLIK